MSKVPSPSPPGPRPASYITGRAVRTALATGGRSSPTSAGARSRSGRAAADSVRTGWTPGLSVSGAGARTNPRNRHTDTITKAATRRQRLSRKSGNRGGLAAIPPARPPDSAGATSGQATGGKEGCSETLLTLVRQLVELRHLERAAPLFQRLPAPVHCGAETVCEGGSNEELAARGACSRQAVRLRPSLPGGGLRGCASTRDRAGRRAGEAAPRGPVGAERGGRGASPDAPARPRHPPRLPALAPGARPALRLRELQAVCFLRGAGGRPGRVARRTRPGFLVALHGGGCARSNVCSAPQTAFLRRLCPSLPPPTPSTQAAAAASPAGHRCGVPSGPGRNLSCERPG